MKKFKFFAIAALAAFALTSCEDDSNVDNNNTTVDPGVITLSGEITSDMTLTKDNEYLMVGRVLVTGGATLTIEPGTVVKAAFGQGANATALIITRSGMIDAQGTADEPIIFTANADLIESGQITSPNMLPTDNSLWGGIIILGEAPISAQNEDDQDVSELQIEGIPTSVDALYGGNNEDDNSGIMTYVSVRHGGSNIGDGNEINGISLGGVGRGTTLNNIEVVGNQDDGIEWYGGSVNMDNVVVWNAGDDALDTDQDWIGTCTNFIIVSPSGSAFELDGPEGSLNRGTHQFTGGVVYAGSDISDLVDWDDNTNAGVKDVYFFGIDADYRDGVSSFGGDGTGDNANWEYTLPAGVPADSVFTDVPAAALTSVSGPGAKTVGPNASNFGWSWAGASGALSSLGL